MRFNITIKATIAFVSLLVLVSCATIMSGTKQSITFDSEPRGVIVKIDQLSIGVTPVSYNMHKGDMPVVTFEKEGYKTQIQSIKKEFDSWAYWDFVLLSLLSTTVDYVSGAMYEYAPDQFYVTMEVEEGASVLLSRRAETKNYIVVAYDSIKAELKKGGGEYINGLLALLMIQPENNKQAIADLDRLMGLYPIIPEYAEQVVTFYKL